MTVNNKTIHYPFSAADMKHRVAYNANGEPEYIGYARPNTAESAAAWQIKKLTYDANNDVTAIDFAGGNNEYDKVWDNRASYTYN